MRRHSSGSSSTGSFSGTGHTLGDGSSNSGPGSTGGGGAVAAFQALDPQVKVFLYLLGGYLVFWWLK